MGKIAGYCLLSPLLYAVLIKNLPQLAFSIINFSPLLKSLSLVIWSGTCFENMMCCISVFRAGSTQSILPSISGSFVRIICIPVPLSIKARSIRELESFSRFWASVLTVASFTPAFSKPSGCAYYLES